MIAAGSPGARYSRLNTNSATIAMTGIVERTRRSDVGEHQVFWTSQNTGNGALITMPVTFLRQAW